MALQWRMGLRLLSTARHDRDAAGLTYVYPVISRRAGGVSVGINLNTNNACNWRCVYCQVPGLVRGVAPDIDLALLESELHGFLDKLLHGRFMQEHVPEHCRRLCDIAISGNGEPTSCSRFHEVVAAVIRVTGGMSLPPDVRLRLITNGSYVHRAHVQSGLRAMAAQHGEVWIKVDAVMEDIVQRINGVRMRRHRLRSQVATAAALCPTWIQTCVFAFDGAGPDSTQRQAYLDFLRELLDDGVAIQGVLLYGLARPSQQMEYAARLSALPEAGLRNLATDIEDLGLPVRVSV